MLAPFIAFSAGSILSTVDDLAKWDAGLYTEKLLKKSSLDRIWTINRTKDGADAAFNYGFGWFIDNFHGHRLVQHSGGTPGFSSVIYRFVDDKLTIILLTNHSDRIIDQMAIDLARMYEPALKIAEGTPDPDPKTTQMLKDVVAGLWNGKHDQALFTPPMRIFLDTATGKAFWKWFGSLGPLGSFDFCDREDAANGVILRYKVVLGENAYWLSCKMTNDGKVAQIYWW